MQRKERRKTRVYRLKEVTKFLTRAVEESSIGDGLSGHQGTDCSLP